MANKKKTIKIKADSLDSAQMLIEVNGYPLREEQLDKLIDVPIITGFDRDLFVIGIGLFLKILVVSALYVVDAYNNEIQDNDILHKVEAWEFWTMFIAFFLSFVIWCIKKFRKTKRDLLIQEIRDYMHPDNK